MELLNHVEQRSIVAAPCGYRGGKTIAECMEEREEETGGAE